MIGTAENPGDLRARDLRVAPRRYGPVLRFFIRTVDRAAARLGGRDWYRRRHLAAGRFRVRAESVMVHDLPLGLDGFRVAQLSDLHSGSFLSTGDLSEVVRAVNESDVDLVVLTGDLITRHWTEALAVLPDLAGLEPRRGCLAVFGNHDYRGRCEGRIAAAFGAAGIRFLRNETVRIDTGDGVLAVVGLEDLEESRGVDLEAARADVVAGDVELVLCHNPSRADALQRPRCAAILSGHTHGNQIDLPFIRLVRPRHPGDRRTVGNTALITSTGLGVVGVPLRIRAPAEIVLIELNRAPVENRVAR